MKRVSEYLALALLAVLLLAPSCRRARIIGQKELSDIYAEMFLADQWVNDNPNQKRTADTTRFYESIFRSHGYSFEDYDASVNFYLHRPEKYKKIMERTQQKLRATQNTLEAVEKEIERQNKILEGLGCLHLPVFSADSVKVDTSMYWAPWRDTLSARRDSVSACADTVGRDSMVLSRKPLRDSLKIGKII